MAYIIPAYKVFNDIENRFGVPPSLPSETAPDPIQNRIIQSSEPIQNYTTASRSFASAFNFDNRVCAVRLPWTGAKSPPMYSPRLELIRARPRVEFLSSRVEELQRLGSLLEVLPMKALGEYVEQNKFAENNVFWLLDQFRGMAEAVKRIHDLSYKEAQTTSLTVNTSAPGERRTAWHHDMKPGNILYFKNSSSNCGMFRFSDWGCGKVNTDRTRSYNTKSPIGTITYQGKTSRPYDVSSLGCGVLEILVWAVFGSKAVESFSDQRDDRRNANSGTNSMTDDAYWHKHGPDLVPRPPVVTQLQALDEALMQPDAPPFKEIVGYIKRMLEPEAQKRIKALELCDLFSRTTLTKAIQVKSRRDESHDVIRFSLIPTKDNPSEALFHELSPLGGPAYAERIDLSPSDISPRASRHSRNSSASDLMPAHATRSRQSSNASDRSYLSIREMKDSHSSANAPRAP